MENYEKENLIILTDENGNFYQHRYLHMSLDVKEMMSLFQAAGYNTTTKTFNSVYNDIEKFTNHIILATSTYDKIYKSHIERICFELEGSNQLIPKYDHFLAHECKIYQEAYKKKVGIYSLNAVVATELTYEIMEKITNDIGYPCIFKLDFGAGGTTVYKVENEDDIRDVYRRQKCINVKAAIRFKNSLKKLIQKFSKKQWIMSYDLNSSNSKPFVIQEMVENLDHDWKVIIFGSRVYTLKRNVPKNDFRASGQGLLEFDVTPPQEVLEYAYSIYQKLDSPYASLDIAQNSDGKCFLIEYQVNAFGPTTVLDSKYYYQCDETLNFTKKNNNSTLERLYVDSVLEYLKSA